MIDLVLDVGDCVGKRFMICAVTVASEPLANAEGILPENEVIRYFSVKKELCGRSGEISAGVSRAPASSRWRDFDMCANFTTSSLSEELIACSKFYLADRSTSIKSRSLSVTRPS